MIKLHCNLRTFVITLTPFICHIRNHHVVSSKQPLSASDFCLYRFASSRLSHKWSSRSLFGLPSFIQHNVLKIHYVLACISTSLLFIAKLSSITYIFHVLFIHSSNGIWIDSNFWCWMLFWTAFKFLCGHLFPFLLGVYLGMELPNNGNSVCIFLGSCLAVFQRDCTIFHFHQKRMRACFSTSLPALLVSTLFHFSEL